MKLIDVAIDLNLDDPSIPTQAFINLLLTARLWLFDWGVILACDNELHIHVMSDYQKKVFYRSALRTVANDMFKEYETLTTKVSRKKRAGLKFAIQHGWQLVGRNETEWHLIITKGDFKYGKTR